VYHNKAEASDVIEWILEGETLDERQRRIQQFLENESYLLPEPPRGAMEYPMAEKREKPLSTMAEDPTDFDLG
jgi:hypothetical protein